MPKIAVYNKKCRETFLLTWFILSKTEKFDKGYNLTNVDTASDG